MLPYIQMGPLALSTYTICMIMGFVVGWQLLQKNLARSQLANVDSGFIAAAFALVGILGARAYHAIEHLNAVVSRPWHFVVISPGVTWYGGFLLCIFFIPVIANLCRQPDATGNQRIFFPNADSASSTASDAVRLCSSMTGFTSTISKLSRRPWSAMISIARWASR